MARPRGKWKTRQPNGRPAGKPRGKVPVQYGELKKNNAGTANFEISLLITFR